MEIICKDVLNSDGDTLRTEMRVGVNCNTTGGGGKL